jgi:hypothetical protein
MKALHVMLKKEDLRQEELKLFSKLKEIKQQHRPIEGIPMVESDSSDLDDEDHSLQVIRNRLALFKQRKAREVANQHTLTKESIENIVLAIKHDLQYEALCIINPKIQDSVERQIKPAKDLGSTLPGSLDKDYSMDTPGFDLPSAQSKKVEVMDLREFTLGQKEQGSSCRSQNDRAEHDSEVS